jgi:hypothetical protein
MTTENYRFVMSKDDTSPILQITCKDNSGTVIPVTGASNILFQMYTQDKATAKVSNNSNTSIVDGAGGIIDYTWQAADTDTTGTYLGRFKVTFSDGSIETFPNGGRYIKVIVGE